MTSTDTRAKASSLVAWYVALIVAGAFGPLGFLGLILFALLTGKGRAQRQHLPYDQQLALGRLDRAADWRRTRSRDGWSVHVEPLGWSFAEDGGTRGYAWRVWAAGGEGAPPLKIRARFPDRRRRGQLRPVPGELRRVEDPRAPDGEWVFEYRVDAADVRDGPVGTLAFGKAEIRIQGLDRDLRRADRYKRLVGKTSPWPRAEGDAEEASLLLPPPGGETCAVCGDLLGERVRRCPRCETPHHQDCWTYNQGCAVFGCEAPPVGAGRGAPR